MLYPMDFHRRVDRRWAERVNLVAAHVHGLATYSQSAGQQQDEANIAAQRSPEAEELVSQG
jgi:hypothetical protein